MSSWHDPGAGFGERLAEIVGVIAEAPDFHSAAEFLLMQLMEIGGAERACLLRLDENGLGVVTAVGCGEAAASLTFPTDDVGHPLVASALSLRVMSSLGDHPLHPALPWGSWVALPYAQPRTATTPSLFPEARLSGLPRGVRVHPGPREGERMVGRAPSGVVLVGIDDEPRRVAVLERLVTLCGGALSRMALSEEYQRAAQRLGAQVQLLTTIVDALPDPVVITDAANNVVVQNTQAEHLVASREDVSIGRRRAVELNNMLFTSFLARSTMTTGTAAVPRELNLVDPDEGTDLLFEVLAHPLADAARSGQLLSVLRNVTDLRRAAHELERQIQRGRLSELEATRERDRLNLILENVADPILVTDDRSNIILMNDQAEKLFAAVREDGPWTVGRQAVRDNDTKFTSFISDFAIDAASSTRTQMRLVHPQSGIEIPMEVVSGKILNERGESQAIVSVLHDQTKHSENERLYVALKQLNAELEGRVAEATADLAAQNARLQWQTHEVEKANKLKSDFLASMSHELRTPINALIGYTALMLDRLYGELTPQQEEGLTRIRSSAQHLLELINDILDLARIEAGKMPVHFEEFSVSDVLTEVTDQLEPLVHKKGLAFTRTIADGIPTALTDRTKVKQIMLNLLSNAVKFTPRGTVSVAAAVKGDRLLLSVADTGIGIKAQDIESVWEDFRQLDQSRTREFGGTGLGLSITRKLVIQLGGMVAVQSEFGKGSTFTVDLPLRITETPTTTAAPGADLRPSAPLPRARVAS
ncbi:MAG: hypothetical protein NVS9B3_04220 [Gemmatimonadaceae bacterium]